MATDPANVNDGCTVNLTRRTAQPKVLTNFSDPDNDGDAAKDDDMDGDGRPNTTPVAQLRRRS